MEAEQEPRDRGLPRAGPAEDADHLARFDPQRHVPQHRLLPVGEGDGVDLEGQRTGRQRGARAVDDLALRVEQLPHPHDAPGCLLQAVHLPGQLLERVAQHRRVSHDGEHRADGDGARAGQRRPQHERRPGPRDEQHRHAGRERRCRQHRAAGRGVARVHVLVELTEGVGVRAARFEVGQPAQPLLEEAAERAGGNPGKAGPPSDEAACPGHHDEGHGGEGGHQRADAPVDGQEHRHDAEQEHRVAEHVHDEPGEEPGDGRHVAVDALDQLARVVGGVERVVEVEDSPGQVDPEGIGGAPAEVDRHVRLGDRRHLRGERDRREHRREAQELGGGPTGLGAVDERSGDQRVRQL